MAVESGVIGAFWLFRNLWSTSPSTKKIKTTRLITASRPKNGLITFHKFLQPTRKKCSLQPPTLPRLGVARIQTLGDTFHVIILITYVVPVLERGFPMFLPHAVSDKFSRLIAIMLGRFRMTVPDCISEYDNLGEEVFGKPRMLYTLRYGLGNRTKYKAANLEKVFKDVAERRSEQLSQAHSRITFPSARGLCRTLVSFSPHIRLLYFPGHPGTVKTISCIIYVDMIYLLYIGQSLRCRMM